MIDMEFENINENNEEENIPFELKEFKKCCRCDQSIPLDQEVFDCDGCPHLTCVCCRFQDNMKCNLCGGPSSGTSDEVPQATSLKELYSMYFTRKRINKDHIVDVELSTEDGSTQKQKCNVCERVFKKSNARYHYACATGEKPHVCVECGKKFVKKSHLESHLNGHYGVRPFKCSKPKCKASFTQKDKLIRHMKSHNKETLFMCSVCGKSYTSQDILNYHMIKVHSSAKQFHCDMCPRSYKYASSLRIHLLKHQAKRDYMCEVCGKKYALSSQLKIHKKSHLLYHRRPFKCKCGKRFLSRRDKARHELTHSSCHDFECSLCNTTFGRKDNLERHMKNFHQDDPPVLTKKKKLVATVRPFNSKVVVKKSEIKMPTAVKKENAKSKSNKIEKLNRPKTDKFRGWIKKREGKEANRMKNPKKCEGKSKHDTIKLPSIGSENILRNDKELNHQSSNVLSQQNDSQNRPSVIKSIPKLLPYKILPPDKRFLKMSEEISKSINITAAPTAETVRVNQSCTNTSSVRNKKNTINKSGISSNSNNKTLDKAIKAQTVKQRISKDDPLNRCFRIIQYTGSVRAGHDPLQKSLENINRLKDNSEGVINKPLDEVLYTYDRRHQNKLLPPIIFSSEGCTNNKFSDRIKQNLTLECISEKLPGGTSITSDSSVGGPSLPTSLSMNGAEINHEDNLTNSYGPMGEATAYIPYFENEYFRDSINSYDPNVENLLPNDLDIGFQYINEQLACSETTISSESRIIKYVSQDTMVIRETYH